jgi:hypothetical protein
LNVDGLIEPEVVAQPLDIGLGDVRVLQVRRERTARRLLKDREQDDRDQQQERDVLQRPADDVREQRVDLPENEPTPIPVGGA